jgi:hypothetical protein
MTASAIAPARIRALIGICLILLAHHLDHRGPKAGAREECLSRVIPRDGNQSQAAAPIYKAFLHGLLSSA